MRSNDVQDELQEGFEAGALPPVGPDGALQLEKLRPIPAPPPRLCEAGPCAHYHRFEIQLDAQTPRAQRDKSGQFVDHEVFHTEVHHYCYPTIGVEMILGRLPVLQCNRWEPMPPLPAHENRQAAFLRSSDGQAYVAELEKWKADQRAAMAAADAVGDAVAEIVIVCQVGYLAEVRVLLPITETLEWLRIEALVQSGTDADPHDWDIRDANGAAFSDLKRTIDQAGLVPESRVAITRKPPPTPTTPTESAP